MSGLATAGHQTRSQRQPGAYPRSPVVRVHAMALLSLIGYSEFVAADDLGRRPLAGGGVFVLVVEDARRVGRRIGCRWAGLAKARN